MGSTILLLACLFFIAVLGMTTIFRVKNIHIGIPSSLFSGRLKKEKDPDGHSIPIRKPYAEGLNYKWPWWSIEELPKEVNAWVIEKRKFPVGQGGTVIVSGVIQYRISAVAAYRYQEVSKKGIEEGLDAELEQIIRTTLTNENVDSAISKSNEISYTLWHKLTSKDIRTSEENPLEQNIDGKLAPIDPTPKIRTLWGNELSYAEHSYGIEILKAKIDTIDPDDNIKEARDNKQREEYEKLSQSTEFQHILEKGILLKEKFPGIPDDEVWEAVQVWQKQTPKEIKTIRVKGADTLTGTLAALIGGKKND